MAKGRALATSRFQGTRRMVPNSKPILRMYVKGFQKFDQLNSKCCLGMVAMVGKSSIDILAARWSVPINGIGEDKIKAAKKARDHIVHRGHYYDDGKERNDDLLE